MSMAKPQRAALKAMSTRLSRLAELSADELEMLQAAEREQRRLPARRDLLSEGEPIGGPRAVLSGWACRVRTLADGRRQIVGFVLPGEFIGLCQHRNPLAPTTLLAVTELVTCPAPRSEPGSGLSEAYARSTAFDDHYLIAQVTRVGRLSAYERIADTILELQDRLAVVDPAAAVRFRLPLTQELLADALGLTAVHVNRTIQALRRDGLLAWQNGTISFPDRSRLEKLVGYAPIRISGLG